MQQLLPMMLLLEAAAEALTPHVALLPIVAAALLPARDVHSAELAGGDGGGGAGDAGGGAGGSGGGAGSTGGSLGGLRPSGLDAVDKAGLEELMRVMSLLALSGAFGGAAAVLLSPLLLRCRRVGAALLCVACAQGASVLALGVAPLLPVAAAAAFGIALFADARLSLHACA
eukprot:6178443-Pleurochrysis_carterae.AAC.1